MSGTPTLLLASTSPRRREILTTLGLRFEVRHVNVDEAPLAGELPGEMVLRLASVKAEAAEIGSTEIVLGADTAVVVDGQALGKPADAADCMAMLEALSGRAHKVLTGVALRTQSEIRAVLSETNVYFRGRPHYG